MTVCVCACVTVRVHDCVFCVRTCVCTTARVCACVCVRAYVRACAWLLLVEYEELKVGLQWGRGPSVTITTLLERREGSSSIVEATKAGPAGREKHILPCFASFVLRVVTPGEAVPPPATRGPRLAPSKRAEGAEEKQY